MFDYEDDAFEAGFVDGLVKEAGRKKKPGMFAKGWKKVRGHLKRNKNAYLAGAGGLAAGAALKHLYNRSQEKDAFFEDDDFYFDGESAIEKIAAKYKVTVDPSLAPRGTSLRGTLAPGLSKINPSSARAKARRRKKSGGGGGGSMFSKAKRHLKKHRGKYLAGAGVLGAGLLAKHMYDRSQEKDAFFEDDDFYFDGESAIEKIAARYEVTADPRLAPGRKLKATGIGAFRSSKSRKKAKKRGIMAGLRRAGGRAKRHLKKHRGAYLAGAGGLAAGALAKHMYDKYRSED